MSFTGCRRDYGVLYVLLTMQRRRTTYKAQAQTRVAKRPLFGLGSFDRANYKYGDYRKKIDPEFRPSSTGLFLKTFRTIMSCSISLVVLFVPFRSVEGF
ncbi:MAG: hypothetical protein ABUK01_14180 [Leptospirales bacterium]